MASWIDAIEAKARIIHQELQSARELARRMGQEPEEITSAYMEMLAKLYREDFSYALLADNADLIARYRGPGVAHREPPVSLVTTVFGKLRAEIQKVAKAIASMEEMKVRSPADLDPQLAGVTYGSLVVGMRVPRPGDVGADGQAVLPGVSDDLYRAVQTAVQSLPTPATSAPSRSSEAGTGRSSAWGSGQARQSANLWQQRFQAGFQGGEQHLGGLASREVRGSHLLDPVLAEPFDLIEESLVLLHPHHQLMGAGLIARKQPHDDVADPRLIAVGVLAIGPDAGARLRHNGSWLHHWGLLGDPSHR
jgi:hypothetical protein